MGEKTGLPAKLSYKTEKLIKDLGFNLLNNSDLFELRLNNTNELITSIKFQYNDKYSPFRNHLLKNNFIFEKLLIASEKFDAEINNKILEISKSMLSPEYKDYYSLGDKVEVWMLSKQPKNEHNNRILSISIVTGIRESDEKGIWEYFVTGENGMVRKKNDCLIPEDAMSMLKMVNL